jgi:hypothetical protein
MLLYINFKERLRLLTAHGVEYLVVGGYALAAYGHPRYTGDIDIWLNPVEDNIEQLLRALNAFGFSSLDIQRDELLKPDTVIQLGYPPARIDLLSSIDGVTFSDAYSHRLNILFGGVDLPVISIAHFKANKLIVGRLKDLADIEALDIRN